MDFKLKSIGFQSQIHWVSNLNPLGLAEKRGELGKGGELGLMRDVSQCALRLMNGWVLSARHPAKQASPHHKHMRPVASHAVLFGLRLRRLNTNARSCLAYGYTALAQMRGPVWPTAALTAEISKKTCNLL